MIRFVMISAVHRVYSTEGDKQSGLSPHRSSPQKTNNTIKKSPSASISEGDFCGADSQIRTGDLILTKVEVMPIMVVLPTLNTSTSTYSIPWELVLAGCTVITLPLVIVFLIFQDQFMSSVTIGAVKE